MFLYIHVSMNKKREGKASFDVMVTNLIQFLVVLVQEEREEVGEEEQTISPTVCTCTFPLDRCSEWTTRTQIVLLTEVKLCLQLGVKIKTLRSETKKNHYAFSAKGKTKGPLRFLCNKQPTVPLRFFAKKNFAWKQIASVALLPTSK